MSHSDERERERLMGRTDLCHGGCVVCGVWGGGAVEGHNLSHHMSTRIKQKTDVDERGTEL